MLLRQVYPGLKPVLLILGVDRSRRADCSTLIEEKYAVNAMPLTDERSGKARRCTSAGARDGGGVNE